MMNARWENWIIMLLGIWTFTIPLSFGGFVKTDFSSPIVWNFLIIGALITVVAALALKNIKSWEEWTNFFSGVWLFFSPWLLGFSDNFMFFSNAIFIGIAVSVLSGLALPIAIRNEKQMF
jgi:hypothetical protein